MREEILDFISTRLKVDRRQLSEATHFTSDLSLDSVRALDLAAELEERFDCVIPDRAVPTLHTVGDLVSFIVRKQS